MPIAASSSSAWMIANLFLLGLRVAPVLLAEALEGVHQRRRRRDRIPRADRGAGVHAAERRRRCCRRSGCCPSSRPSSRAGSAAGTRSAPSRSRSRASMAFMFESTSAGFLRELLVEQRPDHLDVDVEQRRQRAGVGDVLHQDALAHALESLVAHLGERHAEVGDVRRASARRRAARSSRRAASRPDAHLGDVLRVGRGVQRDHQVEVRRARGVAVLADADLVPGGQALDVRREDVLARSPARPCGRSPA